MNSSSPALARANDNSFVFLIIIVSSAILAFVFAQLGDWSGVGIMLVIAGASLILYAIFSKRIPRGKGHVYLYEIGCLIVLVGFGLVYAL